MPLVLKILYSDSFLAANEYIIWACLGMILRLAAWVISFLFVAKAESRLFVILELTANLIYLIFSIWGYKLLGLSGLGIAFALNYLVYFFIVYLIARKRYNFGFSNSFIKCYCIQLMLIVVCLLVVTILYGWQKYAVGCLVIAISCFLGIRGLNQRMNLLGFVKNKIAKK